MHSCSPTPSITLSALHCRGPKHRMVSWETRWALGSQDTTGLEAPGSVSTVDLHLN